MRAARSVPWEGVRQRLVASTGVPTAVVDGASDQMELQLLTVVNPWEELYPEAQAVDVVRLRMLAYSRELDRLAELEKVLVV